MKINFSNKKYQKYLIIVFTFLIIIIGFVFYYDLIVEKLDIRPDVSLPPELFPEIRIDFQVFNFPILRKLEPFPDLPSYPEDIKIGRQNPFAR
jgi:hypothetical protein